MPKSALFVGWGAIIPGREKVAPLVLQDALKYLMQLEAQNKIDSVDTVLLEPHGGDLAGFVLIKGDQSALQHLRATEEFTKIIVGVQLVHTKVGVVTAYTGAEMQSLFHIWDQQEEALLK